MEYLDLWLMHYPAATEPKDPDGVITVIDVTFTDTWRAMEECVKMGLVRNIGISSSSPSSYISSRVTDHNVDFSKKEAETLLASCEIRPAVHQLEKHPYLPQNAFCKWHKEVSFFTSSPLSHPSCEADKLGRPTYHRLLTFGKYEPIFRQAGYVTSLSGK